MDGTFIAHCPGCRAKLKLKRRSVAGKKIRCPKCEKVFIPSIPEEDEDFSSSGDEFGSLADEARSDAGSDDGFEDFGAPTSRPARTRQTRDSERLPARVGSPRMREKRAKKEAEPSSKDKRPDKSRKTVIALVAGGVSFCVMFAVAYFAVTSMMGGGRGGGAGGGGGFLSGLKSLAGGRSDGINAKYLPERPEIVVYIRVADVWNSPAGEAASGDESLKKTIDVYSKAVGLRPEEIESVTLAIAASATMRGPEAGAKLSQLNALSGPDTKSQTRTIVIVRSKKPFDKKAFADTVKMRGLVNEKGVEQNRFSGLPVFRGRETTAVAFPDPTTMLLGSVLAMEEVLANPTPSVPELDAIDPKQHVVVATISQNWPKAKNLLHGRDDGPLGRLIRGVGLSLFSPKLKSAAVSLIFGKSIEMHLTCDCGSAAIAAESQKAIAENMAASKKAGADEPEVAGANVDGAGDQGSKLSLDPLFQLGLYDLRAASRDKTTQEAWSESNGSSTIEFAARFNNNEAQEQARRVIERLAFYIPLRDEEP